LPIWSCASINGTSRYAARAMKN